jgi:hypothetical protein
MCRWDDFVVQLFSVLAPYDFHNIVPSLPEFVNSCSLISQLALVDPLSLILASTTLATTPPLPISESVIIGS